MLVDLRTDYRVNPVGIDALSPRLSWRLQSHTRGTMQSAYQVRVATSADNLHRGSELVWDSGKVASDRSTQLPYAGAPLQSRQRYYWQVRIWNESGVVCAWSEAAWWEMGLLSRDDWRARWISPPIDPEPTKDTPAPLLRGTFELSGRIARARAYVTSLGLYELHLNGQRVGDAFFTPYWTNFEKRLQYQVYDVAALLRPGVNAVGAVLGDGWYRWVPFNKNKHRNNGKPFALLLQIEVVYEDGRIQQILSDTHWKTAAGPILSSGIYHGEAYDARLERAAWATASYDDRAWSAVHLAAAPGAELIATASPPVRRIEEIKPVAVFRTPAGTTVVDMGQNMVGWARLRVRGPAGATVTLRHAEVLDRAGNFYTENLRTAEQTNRYTLKGCGEEVFEPHFTFQGFRYVAVEGFPGEVGLDSLTGVVVHSDMDRAGTLETSNEPLNRLQHNILWTLKGNYLDVPTDCPQRDERLGWALDAQVFVPTAALNMNVAGFLTKYLGDLAADQRADGAVPMESPHSNHAKYPVSALYHIGGLQSDDDRVVELMGIPGYGDGATIIPWHLYLAYGDTRILETQYSSMQRWVQYIQAQIAEGYIWNPALSLGDWLDYETTRKPSWFGSNAFDVMATAFYAHSVDILQRSAAVLGRQDDAAGYAKLFQSICAAFLERFVAADGTVGKGMQVDYVLALDFDLLPERLRPLAAAKLAGEVRARGHATTGLAGTPRLLNVLSRFGYDEEAYGLLTREEMPSWLYHVNRGATTIWERWDSIRPDGSFQDPAMNSFNHYWLGSVGEWMYSVIGGIALDPEVPGYKHILIRPRPGGGLMHASASYQTPYGKVVSAWRIEQGYFHLSVTIPPNAVATVTLPGAPINEVLESGRRIAKEQGNGIGAVHPRGADTVIEVGSGQYEFKYR